MAEAFALHLEHHRLLRPGTLPLVAVSGGLDSVVLLHLLRWASGGHWARGIHVAHYDHAMRPGSARDHDWIAGLCRAWDLPLIAGRAERRLRNEADAREARYAFLEDAADQAGAHVILTAHHADDQAETVLFRLARGTGLAGLRGIHARRGRVVRPLLPFRRATLTAYARLRGIRYRADPTNHDLRYARNRIRHLLMPALECEVPDLVPRLARLAESSVRAQDAWREVAGGLLQRAVVAQDADSMTLARDTLLGYHPAVRARVVRYALTGSSSLPGRAGTRALIEFISSGASGGYVRLPGGMRVERSFDTLSLRRAAGRACANRPLVIEAPGNGCGDAWIGGRQVTVEWTLAQREQDGQTAVFDPTALRFPIEVRAWRPGDTIRLHYGHKKLKKLFAERRVARSERERVPVVADATGRVLWLVGVAKADLTGRPEARSMLRITARLAHESG